MRSGAGNAREPDDAGLSPSRVAAVHAIIGEETVRQCVRRHGGSLRAIILTGSVARDEATLEVDGGKSSVLGDAEFLLVFHDGMPLPPASGAELLASGIEHALANRSIACHLSLSACHAAYLRKLKPHIFAYELRQCGQVVWGEKSILSLIPKFPAGSIPLDDACRLLCNRIVEQLALAGELQGRPAVLPAPLHYRTVKLYLDMATSLLVFAGLYAPSYRERCVRLRTLASSQPADFAWPFDLTEFSRIVDACTEWKLAPEKASDTKFEFWLAAVRHARLLWQWELARLTGSGLGDPVGQLTARWLKKQSRWKRLRGWLYVFRREQWRLSWGEWRRCLRQFWRGSPRYEVYLTACELFFGLPEILAANGESAALALNIADLSGALPVRIPESESRPAGWRGLAHEIVWNYNRFLVETQS